MVRFVMAAGAVTLLLITSCAPSGAAPASTTPGPAAAKATEPCASGGLAGSTPQTAAPNATQTAAATTASTSAPPATPPRSTPPLCPAPTVERVGFPED